MANNHTHPERWDRNIESRDINELLPTVRKMCADFLAECFGRRIDVMIVSTYRDPESQAYLWNHGFSKHAPNWSWHQWRCAFDIVVVKHGRPIGTQSAQDLEIWEQVGDIAGLCGLEWGWNLDDKDRTHFQHTFGREITDMLRGATLPETLSGHINFTNGHDMSKWQMMRASLAHWMMRTGESMYYAATRETYVQFLKEVDDGELQKDRRVA